VPRTQGEQPPLELLLVELDPASPLVETELLLVLEPPLELFC